MILYVFPEVNRRSPHDHILQYLLPNFSRFFLHLGFDPLGDQEVSVDVVFMTSSNYCQSVLTL